MSGIENWFCSLRRKKKSINCQERRQICFISAGGRACSQSHWHRDGEVWSKQPWPRIAASCNQFWCSETSRWGFLEQTWRACVDRKGLVYPRRKVGGSGGRQGGIHRPRGEMETRVGESVWITVTEVMKVSDDIKKKPSQARRGETLWGVGGAYEIPEMANVTNLALANGSFMLI